MATPADSICAYIRAKDGNRPHELIRAFTPAAIVEVVVRTPAISFPSKVTGLEAIADVFVRRFAIAYENVYTFCLSSPPDAQSEAFSCDWLVAMSEKESGVPRVGSGRYDWFFTRDNRRLVEKLVITIDVMQKLDHGVLRAVMDWVAALPYPWCSADLAAGSAPGTVDLAETLSRLASRQRLAAR